MTIALIGNPNSGKTTLFNALTGSSQSVGNWPGVTVEKKEGRLKNGGGILLDLPGIYTLTPFSPEEIVAREALTRTPPELVLNIVDGTNLERNLYLTMQLLELGLPMVVAVNCVDAMKKRGDHFSPERLSEALGCPVVGISALRGFGLGELAQALKAPNRPARRFIAPSDEETAIAARYERIERIVRQCLRRGAKRGLSNRLDSVVLNRYLALPIFVLVMAGVYYISVSGPGAWLTNGLMEWQAAFARWLGSLLLRWQVAPFLRSLILEGLLAGVGRVVGFVPQLLLLYGCLSFLGDCGYLARISFLLDSLLRRFGLSGKCFMPMLLATGCGVPAILGTRAIDSQRERRVTAITCTFLPCSAKLPIIALIAGTLFEGAWWLAPVAYFVGAASILISAKLLGRMKLFGGKPSPFVLELPAYRMPSAVSLLRNIRNHTASFLKKAGTIILLSSLFVWFLAAFTWQNRGFVLAEGMSEGLLARFGKSFEFLFVPLGLGQWQMVVASFTALIAKENAVSTLSILYGASLPQAFTPLQGLSFLLFNLLCAPCVAAIWALRRELGSRKLTFAAVVYQCVYAYVVAAVFYQVGALLR
ncbi:MAG: ferrous iron transporter B [Oscillospiraceae bacterium]|jgi:ferrous iron transport protein B|nr:ferrous iron transporter B [Oscillospiraceae bacterium]